MPGRLQLEDLNIKKHVPPGAMRRIKMHVARLPLGTEIDIHVFLYRGKEDGPVLLLLAGLHGDEINGVEIIRRMMKNNLLQPERGSVMAIPVLNIYGFLNYLRELPDGKDVNRSFPGSLSGSLASMLAYNVTHNVLPLIDMGIDYHTGGASRTNYPQIRCDFKDEKSRELAKSFAPPFIIHSNPIAKSFRKEAAEMKKPIIVYEAGESQRFKEDCIEEGIKGTLRLMHSLNMIDHIHESVIPNKSIIIKKTTWVRAKTAGLKRFYGFGLGEKLKKNQEIGTISDPYNDFQVRIKSPQNGYVIGLNNAGVINKGNPLIHLGLAEENIF
jgi:uncharacterized protein